tara:strand:- start:22 stop:186 length:165 start_codon:yes stop_codon:yes gene_type:complete
MKNYFKIIFKLILGLGKDEEFLPTPFNILIISMGLTLLFFGTVAVLIGTLALAT